MKINKILIANRGEIALRIIRTCKEMGIKTVALCPKKGEEKNFLETLLADEYYFLEEEGSLGYLNKEKIIAIAKKANVDAIHPGYGFLAENAKFALLCRKNNIKFIGPHFKLLQKFEDKVEAKKIARKLGLPTLPASTEPIKTKKELFKWAKIIKPPFIIKAQRGGGGMGIRIIDSEMSSSELFSISLSVQKQMAMAFSDLDFFLEKYLRDVKHIEIQVIGDGENAVCLGERECTIQRRFQKLLEEAPSISISKYQRKQMGKLAVHLIKEMKYEGAATIEFLLDKEGNFYFMEVNPRIQVEHPITEAITGIDIIKEQIRIAEGNKLSFGEDDISLRGYAIEARINAEDPFNNFKPNPGVIKKYIPAQGQGIFMHSFLHDGQEVYPYFDSLLLKIIAYGKDREEALKRLKRALDETIIEGVETTIPFFKMLLNKEDFIKGNYYTNFIEKSGLLKELIATPYLNKELRKRIVEEKLGEKEIAEIVFQIYENFKSKEPLKTEFVSKWVLSERLKLRGE
ncbi:MAG TPA: biotin carboxylase N-terminal domain-containing protein [Candidatus Pacearchaeota archaeon]|nr:biotin carboxylase N-terminal domain-containing protein [Candidatus Pacearchaeota archaeon]